MKIKDISMYKSVAELVAVMDDGLQMDFEDNGDKDPLLEVCKMVGRSQKIDIRAPEKYNRQTVKPKDYLIDIAYESRISIREVKLEGDWWKNDNGSMIAFMREDHRPVALLAVSEKSYKVYDPSSGITVAVTEGFVKRIDSVAYSLAGSLPEKPMTLKEVLFFGMGNVWKRDIFTIFCIGVIGGILGTMIPVATGIIFNIVIPEGDTSQIWQITFFLIASALAGCVFQLTRTLAMIRIEWKMDLAIESAVWNRLLYLPISFFRKYTSGELAVRVTSVNSISSKLSGITISSLLSGIFSVFSYGLLFYYDMWLAVVVTLFIIMLIIFTGLLGYIQMRYQRELKHFSAKTFSWVNQLVDGIAKIRMSGAQNRAFYIWARDFSRQKELLLRTRTIFNYMLTFNSIFPLVSTMFIFYMYSTSSKDYLSAGDFIAFNATFMSFMSTVIKLSQSVFEMIGMRAQFEMIEPIIKTCTEHGKEKANPGYVKGEIELSHVSFRYSENDELALNNVSLHINPGESIGIVGPSGSGKSTLLRVLLGFEKPQGGRIYYDGNDIEKISVCLLRRQMGVVLQNAELIEENIYKNIMGLNMEAAVGSAWEAAAMAAVDEDIKNMPMGMHTPTIDGGKTLSRTQRQKILIARAIAKRPQILLLDEAMGSLDNQSLAVIKESLDKMGATRIVVSHSISAISNCDRIIVLDKGKIVEQGSFEELKNSGGYFKKLLGEEVV